MSIDLEIEWQVNSYLPIASADEQLAAHSRHHWSSVQCESNVAHLPLIKADTM